MQDLPYPRIEYLDLCTLPARKIDSTSIHAWYDAVFFHHSLTVWLSFHCVSTCQFFFVTASYEYHETQSSKAKLSRRNKPSSFTEMLLYSTSVIIHQTKFSNVIFLLEVGPRKWRKVFEYVAVYQQPRDQDNDPCKLHKTV